jgi:hypothetical protein
MIDEKRRIFTHPSVDQAGNFIAQYNEQTRLMICGVCHETWSEHSGWACGNQPTLAVLPSPTTSTTCARCSHTFASKPDGFVDVDLEIEIAAHQERCFVVGEDTRWQADGRSWADGKILSLGATTAIVKVWSVSREWTAFDACPVTGQARSVATTDLRRIPRPGPRPGEIFSVEVIEGGCRNEEEIRAEFRKRGTFTATVGASNAESPVLYDGLTAAECLRRWLENRTSIETGHPMRHATLTLDQIAAGRRFYTLSTYHSHAVELRAKVAASAESERLTVRVDLDDLDGEPWW